MNVKSGVENLIIRLGVDGVIYIIQFLNISEKIIFCDMLSSGGILTGYGKIIFSSKAIFSEILFLALCFILRGI